MPKSLPERLRWIFEHKNIDRAQLARDAVVSNTSVHSWLAGKVNELAIDKCVELSKVYNLPVEWLAGDVEEDPIEYLDKPPQNKPVFLTTDDPLKAMRDFQTLKERLRWLVYHKQVLSSDLAKVTNVANSTVSQWMSGKIRSIKPEYQHALTEYYQLPPEFFDIQDTKSRNKPVLKTRQLKIDEPILIDNLSPLFFPLSCLVVKPDGSSSFEPCKKSAVARWIVLDHLQLSMLKERGTSISDLKCIEAWDDSMYPRISSQDLVLVDTSKKEIIDNQIYLISVQNRPPIIRKLLLNDREDVGIVSENGNNFQTIIRNAEVSQSLRILGKVVFRAG